MPQRGMKHADDESSEWCCEPPDERVRQTRRGASDLDGRESRDRIEERQQGERRRPRYHGVELGAQPRAPRQPRQPREAALAVRR